MACWELIIPVKSMVAIERLNEPLAASNGNPAAARDVNSLTRAPLDRPPLGAGGTKARSRSEEEGKDDVMHIFRGLADCKSKREGTGENGPRFGWSPCGKCKEEKGANFFFQQECE